MEDLILKIPNNKPPFIGVMFDIPYSAKWAAIDWFENKKGGSYRLVLEPSKQLILYLAQGSNMVRHAMEYDPVKLLKFMALTKDCKAYNFGYVKYENNEMKIIKTDKNISMVMKIEAIEIRATF